MVYIPVTRDLDQWRTVVEMRWTIRFHKMQVCFLASFFSPHGATASLVSQSLLIIEKWQSHSNTPNSVGLLCTSDQPYAETSTWQHPILNRRQTCPQRESNRQIQQAASRRHLRPVFLNRQAAARYRTLASIIPGRERFSWNLSF